VRRLPLPQADPDLLLNECASNVTDLTRRLKYTSHRPHFAQASVGFKQATASVAWCELARVPNGAPQTIIFGTLTKGELTSLYSDHMVGSRGISRQRYDDILVLANGKCPFCGGIGHAKTLDHYLPKANFPQYAIYPDNLVPCCRDCNSVKQSSFPYIAVEQTIHPYMDHARFFDERWVTADIIQTNPVAIRFEARPPINWDQTDIQRALSHFRNYDLPRRFGIEAGSELAGLIDLRRTVLSKNSPQQFQNYLTGNSNIGALPLNGWKRTMYAALSNDAWFCSAQF
jgi:hypothetical protein